MINQKETVIINDVPHAFHWQGEHAALPILLVLHGGPGVPNRHHVFKGHDILFRHFMVVGYDQRGCGGSYFKTKPQSLTLEQYLDDLNQIVDLLCERFDQKKVYLLGGSWGTELGTLYAYHHPEKLHAYIGYGQVVNGHLNETLSYDFVYQAALSAGDTEDVNTLAEIGAPVNGCYREVYKGLRQQRNLLAKYTPRTGKPLSFYQSMIKPIFFGGEYSLKAIYGYIKGVRFTLENAWPRIVHYDFMTEAIHFDVPIFLFQGRHDFTTPSSLISRYYDAINAPYKQLTWFEHSGHGPFNEERDKFHEHLLQDVLKGEHNENS